MAFTERRTLPNGTREAITVAMGSALLTLTTTPVELTDGIESLLTPLKWIRFPVHELALIIEFFIFYTVF